MSQRLDATMDALWAVLQGSELVLGLRRSDLSALPSTGLAHDHIRIGRETGWLARVPKQSQWDRPAQQNLTYQAACFERVSETLAGPFCRMTLPVSQALPFGALIVAHIDGRPAVLPDDLPLIAECLAKIHAAPLPAALSPLEDHKDCVGPALIEIEQQLSLAGSIGPPVQDWLQNQLATMKDWSYPATTVQTLVATDTHPGNYIVRGDQALIVDLEKALYGNPGIDLAHASVYTSTTWEKQGTAILTPCEVTDFYQTHLELLPADLAQTLRPWLIPTRWLLYLRALSWCAKFLNEIKTKSSDWAADKNDDGSHTHLVQRAQHYLEIETIDFIDSEMSVLTKSLQP